MTSVQQKMDAYNQQRYNRMEETPDAIAVSVPPAYPTHTRQQALGIDEPSKPFAFDALILNVITYLCCCPLMGFIGTIAALLSYSDHRVNDHVSHKSKRNIALCCGIGGMVLGIIMIIAVIAIVVTTIATAEKAVGDISDSLNNGNIYSDGY